MPIYHPGKVIVVYSPTSKDVMGSDSSTQALVEMWDENIFTCDVEKSIASKLKEGDVVLIDYNPVSLKLMIPRQSVTKILRGATAKKTMERYAELHKKKKAQDTSTQKMPSHPPPSQLYG
jgi:hypothetical protein